jgi:hypothetical protein
MGQNNRIVLARERLARESQTKVGFWENIIPFINKEMVVPIISNSFRLEQIFRDEKELSDQIGQVTRYDDEDLTLDEQLTKEWAEFIKYPMPDSHNLARVAQYFLVEQKEDSQARESYLDFLKSLLLSLNEGDESYKDIAQSLKKQVREKRFSEIVRQLDYPRFPPNMDDPLRLLTKLDLPIYVTTSPYDFIERALEAEDKKPRTQVCFWSGTKARVRREHLPDKDFEPAPKTPAVYHLYGLEDYPQTLVLSEDDYMNFLMSVAEDTDSQNPIVPNQLRHALAESRLLLLGYHIRDWDFRVLFRFILKFRPSNSVPRGMVIQLKPGLNKVGNENNENNERKSIEYLSNYFDRKQFDVEWNNTEKFIYKLWDEWDKYRKGQNEPNPE